MLRVVLVWRFESTAGLYIKKSEILCRDTRIDAGGCEKVVGLSAERFVARLGLKLSQSMSQVAQTEFEAREILHVRFSVSFLAFGKETVEVGARWL
ncbi:hypothetical protein HG531_013823 [Fusarium graminearum]|nr:hypothetical protein HG531_013823 [Fusarium graminearum]